MLWLKNRFHWLVDRLLPPGYATENAPLLGRARILVAVLLFNTALALAVILLALYAHPFSQQMATLVAAGISGAVVIAYIGCLLLFRRTGSITGTGHLFAVFMYAGMAGSALFTGGADSPSLQMLLVVPVLVFLIAGRKPGLQWLLITLLTQAAFYQASLHEIRFVQTLDAPVAATIRLGVWTLMAITVLACFLIYDVVNESLQRQLSRERGRFAHQAAHDVLTALPNRGEFYRLMDQALAPLSGSRRLALAYIDLDHFKPINDTYGHHAGDEVLKIISQRLLHSVRRQDTVARLGGDEFAILFLLDEPGQPIEPMLQNLLTRIHEPIRTGEHLVQVSGSVGVVFAPDHGRDIDVLLKLADQCMYQAKQEKNRFCIYTPA